MANTCFGCCGVRIEALDARGAVELLESMAANGGGGVHLCNSYTLSLATQDSDLATALNADINLADGVPVALVGRFVRRIRSMRGPVRGPSLMYNVIEYGLVRGRRHYFYGSTESVLRELRLRLIEQFPDIEIAGMESPPFRTLSDAETAEVVQKVSDSGAHYLWVGLGTPKQDWFISRVGTLSTAVSVGVGAAFDFASGNVREAPAFLHGSGFEWLYRLQQEPRRLVHRYTIGGLRFVVGLLRMQRLDRALTGRS
ncbi:N-acetylglucosaminyldiphosphoundecaprenol N-acetyl-beta-D-mannosaminyltransferase [Pseudonocardia sediminis]|uniref:N-acetylglucosaminyldiphosphoundecaprenol N-acetyl-beta-D-mannosaminyltransferase n=1 Tax=Pseudonocardia sediminis TaxID=1397368 RepID=A0A4Q7V1B0_PSEST|nr:N-acetylglucosaminyldiphosphoundecaprenol N-acetyl-beta-D-mannosaminyltransferase [Pseudonocardia sediminis]